jgi:hypothetical protein
LVRARQLHLELRRLLRLLIFGGQAQGFPGHLCIRDGIFSIFRLCAAQLAVLVQLGTGVAHSPGETAIQLGDFDGNEGLALKLPLPCAYECIIQIGAAG